MLDAADRDDEDSDEEIGWSEIAKSWKGAVVLPTTMTKNWFPKTLAEWKEPKEFTRWRSAEELKVFPRRAWYLFLLLFAVVLLGPECRGPDGFQVPEPGTSVEALLKLLVMVCIPSLTLLARCRIWISEHGFRLGNRWLPFDTLLRVVPLTREIDGRRFTVLRLDDVKGESVDIAVADTISLARIEEVLQREGVRFGS